VPPPKSTIIGNKTVGKTSTLPSKIHSQFSFFLISFKMDDSKAISFLSLPIKSPVIKKTSSLNLFVEESPSTN
jgi:hypothetical protein